ncbi:MAG: cupin domain-containing protein [Prevotellaceae bacterium]|jgi:quercetin dioxygenase-like cupin family protein|nr:cupin domain-containing protein [Prevotellaceae bacterium]
MKAQSKPFLFERNTAWEPAGEGVRRQIMGYDGQLMLVKVEFQTGAIGTPHTHVHSQSSFVVSGKFAITIEGETTMLSPGDGFYVEPNALHGATCIEAGVLVDAFSPARADFLANK